MRSKNRLDRELDRALKATDKARTQQTPATWQGARDAWTRVQKETTRRHAPEAQTQAIAYLIKAETK